MYEPVTSEGRSPSLRRLFCIHCVVASAFSILLGVVVTVQYSFGLAKFGGLEYAPRVLAFGVVRVLGGGTSVAAMLYALLVWTHPLNADSIRTQLLRAAPATVGLVLLTAPFTTALAVLSGDLTSNWVYGVSWALIFESRSAVTGSDFAAATLTLGENLVVASVFSWFLLPLMRRRSWSLLRKLGTTCAILFVARLISGLFSA